MKGRITSRKSVLSCMLMLALSGQSSWAAQNNRVAQGNDFLSTIQQIDVKPMDFPEPTRRPQTPSASRAQINDLQQEIARLKKQLKAAEQEKKSLGASDALEAQNAQLLKDNSALAKENDRLNRSLQNAQRDQGVTTTQQAARIEALEQKTAELQATLASKTAELAALKKTSDTHAVSESALQKQIARLEQEKAALAQQNTQSTTRFNNDMQALRAELNKRAGELVALKKAGADHAQNESALQKQLAQLEQEKAALAKQNTQSVDALNQKTQALQAELDKRAAELAALKKAGADHAQSESALQKQLAQLEQEKATLAKQNAQSVDALNQKTQALQAELDKRVNEVAALKQQNDLLELKTSTLSKEEKEKLKKTQAEQAALLQKNQAAEAALNAQIAALTEKLNASTALVTRTQEKATALEAALASIKGSESDKDRALQSQQQQAAQIAAAKEALNQQLTTAQAEITTLKQSLTDKENQLQASEKTLLALKAEMQTAKALSTATATDQQKAQTELETLKRANQELTDKLASLNAENAAQKAQAEKEKAELLAQAEKLKAGTAAQTQTASQTGPEANAASLKDKASKQSYANGVMFSRLVQKSMDQMTDLGIKTDLPLLLMGIKDGLAQKVAIEPKLLLTLHESMLKELSSREEKKYEAGINQLEKITAQKKLLKRNKSLFFIQTKAGKKAIAPGETVNVAFKEATVDGRVLNDNANVPVTYDENLPYIFQQALELGKRGGVMEVYCFAGDLYNPDTMPPQLFNYSLMKLTVTISAGK
ncbi:hypothetical protein QLY43_06110 [Cronobacter dublinensis]|uniref:hypothetical protein n=1 Tax=Cronobacter dublinensis TaxID=413497 RepID=UPI0024AFD4C0|nr:hypothetical protein [Cronobacter dublinensis]MDI7396252.1 hypothetical protein [Cronobacter dublinensis]